MVYWLKIQAWLIENATVLGFGAIMLVIGLTAWQVDSCRTRNAEKKKEQIKQEIQEGKIESNIQANRIIETAINANKANENVNAVRSKPTNEFPATFNEARRKFCAEFPNDPICKD